MSTDADTPYTTAWSENAQSQLRKVARRAIYRGIGPLVAVTLHELLADLRHRPKTAGEPMYRSRRLALGVRKIARTPLYMEYGVHDTKRFVVIRRVMFINDSDDLS